MIKKLLRPALVAAGWLVASPVFATLNTSYNIELGNNDPEDVVVRIINWVLGVLALVAVIMVLIGGFKWMTAGGNDEKIESAKKLLYAAIIGLLIIVAAWGVSLYAINTLLTFTNS